jgi:peptidyl-prolyl cis-trans isomerase D
MAVIGRIRKRVGLLIGFIGVSLLLFILGDVLTSGSGMFNSTSDVVGEINGEKVHYQEFENRVETMIENYKINTKNETIDQNTQDMLREQAWTMFINDNTLSKEYEKLGLSCSSDELYELCTGKNPHPQIRQAFTDPKTQQFDPNAVIKFLKDLPNRDEKLQRQWSEFETAIKQDQINNKYKNLLKNSIYVNSAEAKTIFTNNQRTVNIRFVKLDYNTIPDSTVKVDDNDLKTYYNENKKKYNQAENIRKVEYVSFDVVPSADDRAEVISWVEKKKDEFVASTDDASFVAQNSDTPYDSTYHAKGSLPPVIDSVFFNAPIGTVVGPYENNNGLSLSKLAGETMVSDSVHARHILLKVDDGDTAKVIARADSLKSAIKKGSKFDQLAMNLSADPGSAIKGGDLGWFRQGAMVPTFNDASFNGKKGDMPIVTSQFGVHLIEILDKSAGTKQVRVATVTREFKPSTKTYNQIYNKATAFAAEARTAEEFDSTIIKLGLNKKIADNLKETDKNIAGLDQPRELIRWAFTAEKGDVSKIYTFGEKYVIAHLTGIKEKGTLPLEAVKESVTSDVRRQKKAEMLIEKFNATGAKDIDAIAQKLNSAAMDVDNVSFENPYVQGMGNEPSIVGAVFAYKAGQVTPPLKGENNVAVVQVKSFKEPAETKDYSMASKQLTDQRKSRSDYEVFNSLKEKAGIVDNRGKFY